MGRLGMALFLVWGGRSFSEYDAPDCGCAPLSLASGGLCKIIKPDSVFLTDCSTMFSSNCLLVLQKALLKDQTLVGVTARMRVMSPSETFEVSEASLAFQCHTQYIENSWSRSLGSVKLWTHGSLHTG